MRNDFDRDMTEPIEPGWRAPKKPSPRWANWLIGIFVLVPLIIVWAAMTVRLFQWAF